MDLKDRQVLLTGAAGFIGSHVLEALHTRGAKVRAFIRYTSRNDRGWIESLPKKIIDSTEIIAGDIKDPDAVRHAVTDCDVVLHLAALIGIPYSYVHPRNYVDTNITGTTNILTAALDHGVSRVVHISTSEVYGTAQYVPIDEAHPRVPQSPYSASKISADMLAESFYRSFDLPMVIIRPFNTYGPRQSRRAVIPTIITQLLSGKTLRIGATSPTRDFTFVTDTAEGILRGAESDEAIGKTLNLGSGTEISIGHLIEMISGLLGTGAQLETDEQRLRPANSEVERLVSNNSLAAQTLGWKPAVSLQQGLAETIKWFKENPVKIVSKDYIR